MPTRLDRQGSRIVAAFNGRKVGTADPEFELELSRALRGNYRQEEIANIYLRFSVEDAYFDNLIRRACVRALAKSCGHGLRVAPKVSFKHLETFEIGNHVVIGEGSVIHGRYDGQFVIGDKVWIGAQSFLDARDLVIGDWVGWGPGAKVLGAEHVGVPAKVARSRSGVTGSRRARSCSSTSVLTVRFVSPGRTGLVQ